MATEFQEPHFGSALTIRTGGEMATRKSSCNCGKLSLTYDGPASELPASKRTGRVGDERLGPSDAAS
jgi:hypothetical protein